jgi:hypothetical protein
MCCYIILLSGCREDDLKEGEGNLTEIWRVIIIILLSGCREDDLKHGDDHLTEHVLGGC